MKPAKVPPANWLVDLAGTREWVEAGGALPAVVRALDRHRSDVFFTLDEEVFYATRVGCDRAIAVDTRLAFERAKWTSEPVG